MAFTIRHSTHECILKQWAPAGYSGSAIEFTSQTEYTYQCGNTIVLRDGHTGRRRIINGTSFGIQTFKANSQHGVLAIADKGNSPSIHIYDCRTLERITSIQPRYELGVSCLAFSADAQRLAVIGMAPNNHLSVYTWRTGEVLVSASIPAGVSSPATASFHPYDSDKLLMTGSGVTLLWQIQRLWEKQTITHTTLQLAEGKSDAHTCHGWSTAGVYIGTSAGDVHHLAYQLLFQSDSSQMTGSGTAGVIQTNPTAGRVKTQTLLTRPSQPPSPCTISSNNSHPSVNEIAKATSVNVFNRDEPVLHLSLNRDLLVVSGPGRVAWLLHGAYSKPPQNLIAYYEHNLSQGVRVVGQALGGVDFSVLMLGCTDGCVLQIPCPTLPETPHQPGYEHPQPSIESNTEEGEDSLPMDAPDYPPPEPPMLAVVVDAHVGPVTGLVPHPSAAAVLSCGTDGTVRVWDAENGSMLASRSFKTPLTSITSSPHSLPMIAVGSETGVVRLMCVATPQNSGSNPSQPLQVTWRKRVHSSAVTSLVFSPNGTMLASAGHDQSIWFYAINTKDGSATVIGQILCPEPILCMTWPEVQDTEDCVLVSLASGGLLAATAPLELLSSHKPVQTPDMSLSVRDVTIKVTRLESPMLSMVSVPGEKYGELLGMGADGHVHKVALPVEGQAWAGLKGRVHKSTMRVPVHARVAGCIALAPSKQLVATGSQDGTIATHTVSLMTLGTLAPRTPRGADASSADGNELAAFSGGVKSGIHDITMDGTAFVSFDSSGRRLVSAGSDGSMFVYEIHGSMHVTRQTSAGTTSKLLSLVASGAVADVDAVDDVAEPTVAAAASRQRAAGIVKTAGRVPSNSAGIATRLQELKQELIGCIAANDNAPDLERLSRVDMLVNKQLHDQLLLEAEQHVSSVKQSIQRSNTALEVVAARVKDECWNKLDVKGERIAGIQDTERMVANFPLYHEPARQRALSKVVFLRRMEILDTRQTSLDAAARAAVMANRASMSGAIQDGALAGSGPTLNSVATFSRRQSLAGAEQELPEELIDMWAAAGNETDIGQLLYPDVELRTPARKAVQMHLLKQQAYLVKQAFNEEWEKVAKQKQMDTDKIADLNGRLEDIVKELQRLGTSPPSLDELWFTVQYPEDMKLVLEVRDDEVQLADESADGKEETADNAVAGETGAKSGGEGAAGERALKQMMGGTLAAKEEDNTEFVLSRPEWMDGNPKLFSTEQLKEFKDFQIKERMMAEEKTKRIGVLEQELRTVSTAIDDTAAHFDDMLDALSQRRDKACGEVAALECRIIGLASALDACTASDETAVKDVALRVGTLKDQRAKLLTDMTDKRHLLTQLENQFAEVAQEDKLLDKNFKKEFSFTDSHYAQLLHLYRLRVANNDKDGGQKSARQLLPQSSHGRSEQQHVSVSQMPGLDVQQAATQGTATTQLEAVLNHPALVSIQAQTLDPWPPLPLQAAAMIYNSSQPLGTLPPHLAEEPETLSDQYMPDGLPQDAWSSFQSYRASKIQCERKLWSLSASLDVLRCEVSQLEATAESLSAQVDEGMAQVQRMRAARKSALLDVDVQQRLKAGQIEVCPAPGELLASDASSALLLHRQHVEALNAAVQAKGAKKIEVLRQIKDFCRGTHMVQWDASRCEMLIEELREKVRDIQLLHVTREMQTALAAGSAAATAADKQATAAQQASMEALARQRDKLHIKTLMERSHQLKSLEMEISQQAAQNTEVARHLIGLQKVLEEQQRLRSSLGDDNEAANKKMRSLVTHKKLKEIAMAQAQEIRTLSAEVERLRLKTYPTFIEQAASPFPADIRLPPTLTHHHHAFPSNGSPRGSPNALLPLDKSQPGAGFNALGSPKLRQ